MRRLAAGVLAIGVVAGGMAMPSPAMASSVPMVSTSIDEDGRPVVSVHHRITPGAEPDSKIYAFAAPVGDDYFRSEQWDLNKINMPQAWQTSTGAGQVVAVIDSGVDASHPDLAGQVLSGYDATTGTTGVSTDPNGHGTHVAGTIAALTDNGIGISAMAPDVKILPVRVLGADGSGDMSDAVKGIVWAADHGADIINLSLGGTQRLTAMSNAIAYARSKGVVVIAAAGNARKKGSPVSYPAADTGVIAVAATTSTDAVADYSNAGSYVDVAAPGSGIVSTYPGNKYMVMNGTSMAAPHVAAEAALIRAAQPTLSPDAVAAAIQNSAVDLGAAGRDNDFGYGRIDVAAALARASKATPSIRITPAASTAKYGATQTTRFTVTVAGQPAADRTVQICRSVSSAAFTCSTTRTTSAGIASTTVRATAPYRLRLGVPGTSTTNAVTSSAVSYRVQATVTAKRASKTSLSVTVGGVNGQTVKVQRLSGRTWQTVKTFRAVAKKTVTGLTAKRKYRIVVPGTATYAGVTGSTVTL